MKAEANLNVPTVGRQSFSVEANNEEVKTLIVGGLIFGGIYLLYRLIDKEEPPKVYVEICDKDDIPANIKTFGKSVKQMMEEAERRKKELDEEFEKAMAL